MTPDSVGMRVKRKREELGLSRQDLAAKSGLTKNAIGLIERDVTDRSKRLPEVALGLGVSLEWLLHGGGDENKNESMVEYKMLSAISGSYQAVTTLGVEYDHERFARLVMSVYKETLIDDSSVEPASLARGIIRSQITS